jgi:16S rRNA (guanine966-N2)-methyltransferase
MRIISGFLKGKKIDFINSKITRPIRNLVKESIFNIILHSNLVKVNLNSSNVLDLYSGVGSFGLECLSRGAKKVTFVEKDLTALEVLKKNINNLKIGNFSEIYPIEISSYIKTFSKEKFDIIFLDPPFAENNCIDDLSAIKETNMYSKKHLIIVHREQKTIEALKDVLNIISTKNYGRSKIVFGTF